MPLSKRTLILAVGSLMGLGFTPSTADDSPKNDGWISLFNGKDLTGWTPKITGYDAGDNYADVFRVEDGLLKVKYDKFGKFDGKFGHLYSKNAYSNYRLRIEYRFVGDQCEGGPGWALRNSGVMIHCQPLATMRKDQDFPVCLEVQFLGGSATGERHTGNLCTPGTHVVMDGKLEKTHCINSTSKTIRGDEWVTAEVEVHGSGKITHYVDGKEVITYEKPQLDVTDPDAKARLIGGDPLIKEGYLALQAESHPIEFRKVEILPLDK